MVPRVPNIRTERLVIRRLVSRDADALTSILQDPDVVEFVNDGWVPSRASVARWIAASGPRLRDTGLGMRAVMLRAGRDPIGWLETSERLDAPGAELTVGIAATHRGLGYGAEAVSGLIAASPVQPIYAWVESANPVSLRMLLGCGFREIGRSSEAGGSAKVRLGWCRDDASLVA